MKHTKQDGGQGYLPADDALLDSILPLQEYMPQLDRAENDGNTPKRAGSPLYMLLVVCVIHPVTITITPNMLRDFTKEKPSYVMNKLLARVSVTFNLM